MGMLWGDYLYDIAVSEAVARIIDGTIFVDENGKPLVDDIGPGANTIKSPLAQPKTRATSRPHLTKSNLKVKMPVQGMHFTEDDQATVHSAQSIEK